jgi:hypothetical protein
MAHMEGTEPSGSWGRENGHPTRYWLSYIAELEGKLRLELQESVYIFRSTVAVYPTFGLHAVKFLLFVKIESWQQWQT